MVLDFERKQVVVDATLINYYFYNPKNIAKNTIIFLHGWRSDSSVWFKFLDDEKFNDYQIYLIDLPGYGKSEIPKEPFDLKKYAKVMNSFIKKVNIKNPIAIGHSFGGALLIKLASDYPDDLKALVLIGASGIRKRNLKKTVLKIIAKLISPFFKPKFMKKLRIYLYRMIGSDDYVATPYLKETYLNVIKEDLTKDLEKINLKTLLIWGNNDNDTPLYFAHVMKDKIKDSSLKIIENAGHFVFISHQKSVSDYIINFINQNV